jgi:hypothetical protein
MEGGATRAAAIATWALGCAQGDVLVDVAALRSRTARHFLLRSCLAESVGMMVGVTLLCTLGTDGCTSMERVVLLLSSVWVPRAHLEVPAPSELVASWVFAPSELGVGWG